MGGLWKACLREGKAWYCWLRMPWFVFLGLLLGRLEDTALY